MFKIRADHFLVMSRMDLEKRYWRKPPKNNSEKKKMTAKGKNTSHRR